MKKSFVLLAWVLFSALTLSAQDRSVNIQNLPRINVSGHAEEKVQPDTFEISVVFGETKEFFGKQNIEKLEQQIVDVLKGSGFDIQKDVKVTSSYNIAEGKTVFIRKRIAFTVHSYAQYYDIAKQLDFKRIDHQGQLFGRGSAQIRIARKSPLRRPALGPGHPLRLRFPGRAHPLGKCRTGLRTGSHCQRSCLRCDCNESHRRQERRIRKFRTERRDHHHLRPAGFV